MMFRLRLHMMLGHRRCRIRQTELLLCPSQNSLLIRSRKFLKSTHDGAHRFKIVQGIRAQFSHYHTSLFANRLLFERFNISIARLAVKPDSRPPALTLLDYPRTSLHDRAAPRRSVETSSLRPAA